MTIDQSGARGDSTPSRRKGRRPIIGAMQELIFESTTCLSQEEFAAWVERRRDDNHYELLNGRVVMTPPAGWPHGAVGSRIQQLLANHVFGKGLGHVFDSSQGFELPSGDTVEPDHTYVSTQRWKAAPAPREGRFLRVVPDLLVEVLSGGTASRDRGEKKAIYERNGVREYWLVDARALTLTAFVIQETRFDRGRVFDSDERFRATVLPDLEFAVRALFPE
jgi:Uma2 family endonuclease